MKNYWKHLRLLAYRLLIVFVVMTLTRLLFYFMNISHFDDLTTLELIRHLFYGLQFDMASIFMTNIIFVILSLIPGPVLDRSFYQAILKWLYISVNFVIIGVNFIDCKFFEFQEKRLTADIFTPEWLGNDFIKLLPQFLADYWYLFLLFVAVIILLIKIYPKYKPQNNAGTITGKIVVKQSLISFLILFVAVVCGRGTLQLKPLRVITAAAYTTPTRIPIVLNSSFTIIKTLKLDKLPQTKYFENEELDSIYTPVHQYGSDTAFTKKNVVIIIMESFGREYSALLNRSDTGYTPCLDSIMRQGLYCTHAYANGKRSIEAMPCVISGIPAIMTEPFITSSFTSNSIEGIAGMLKPYGYTTAFFHGGNNGTMGFDNFAHLAGFEKYFGLNEYDSPIGKDGPWGISDEPFLNFVVQKVSEMPQPFAAGVFTLSSHHPYFIPEKYTGKFPKGSLVNLESIGYADYALGKFFEQASKQDWFKNTLFVITADHTAQSEKYFYQTSVGHYAIPIVFYCPADSLMKGQYNHTTQQSDILPSVMDYIKYPRPFVAFGSSIFDSVSPRFAVSYLNGLYQLITDHCSVSFDGRNMVNAFSIAQDSLIPLTVNNGIYEEANQDVTLLKAIIQQYNSRMLENRLVSGK